MQLLVALTKDIMIKKKKSLALHDGWIGESGENFDVEAVCDF